MANILIVGATSAIAEACARLYAARGARLHLIARNAERLALLARDLEVRGAQHVSTALCDFSGNVVAEELLSAALAALGALDIMLVAHGVLPDQADCERDIALVQQVFAINTLSVFALVTAATPVMIKQAQGTIAVISSVAGDRGRPRNYVYGASKAAVDAFLSGLRARVAAHGIHVVTIKPGFVDTPMTADFAKGPLWASAEQIAAGILNAIDKRRDVVYLPWFWRGIMFIVRAIPERLFKRLSL